MKYELEEVERDYIEFRKEIGEDNNERVRTFLKSTPINLKPKSIT